ncbi:hypothetical protein AHF37_12799 [Paragonimus kellicotti]|nr:hypothetical protein AHF37_12799 [Paragonimus kellicotti]
MLTAPIRLQYVQGHSGTANQNPLVLWSVLTAAFRLYKIPEVQSNNGHAGFWPQKRVIPRLLRCQTMRRRVQAGCMLTASIAFILTGLVLNQWSCGGLFTSCLDWAKAPIISVISLICSGLACLVLGLVMELINCCAPTLDYNPSYTTTRLTLLLMGIGLVVSGVVVFTASFDQQWSYLLTVTGVVFAFQVCVVAIFNSQCARQQTVIRQRAETQPMFIN